ncbi:MAG: hypothetical protein Q8Q07_06055 [Dehalococcoidales bacterium]|nr:hypothetical protein [Dehalococcoidales bacterium]
MSTYDERIKYAVKHTEILRAPKQSLYTFGTTIIRYYIVTEPAYSELIEDVTETVVREGRVIAERPKIVTPHYLFNLEGFSTEARSYLEALITEHGAAPAGLLYSYKNEPEGLNIISDDWRAVVDRINADIDKRGDPLAAIIKGEDELWDVSLMKFICEVTGSSVEDNLRQMSSRGLLKVDSAGIPADARLRIEELFKMVTGGGREPVELKDELDRWGLFEEYQDRFFNLFRKR